MSGLMGRRSALASTARCTSAGCEAIGVGVAVGEVVGVAVLAVAGEAVGVAVLAVVGEAVAVAVAGV